MTPIAPQASMGTPTVAHPATDCNVYSPQQQQQQQQNHHQHMQQQAQDTFRCATTFHNNYNYDNNNNNSSSSSSSNNNNGQSQLTQLDDGIDAVCTGEESILLAYQQPSFNLPLYPSPPQFTTQTQTAFPPPHSILHPSPIPSTLSPPSPFNSLTATTTAVSTGHHVHLHAPLIHHPPTAWSLLQQHNRWADSLLNHQSTHGFETLNGQPPLNGDSITTFTLLSTPAPTCVVEGDNSYSPQVQQQQQQQQHMSNQQAIQDAIAQQQQQQQLYQQVQMGHSQRQLLFQQEASNNIVQQAQSGIMVYCEPQVMPAYGGSGSVSNNLPISLTEYLLMSNQNYALDPYNQSDNNNFANINNGVTLWTDDPTCSNFLVGQDMVPPAVQPGGHTTFPAPLPPAAAAATGVSLTRAGTAVSEASSGSTKRISSAMTEHIPVTRLFHSAPIIMFSPVDASPSSTAAGQVPGPALSASSVCTLQPTQGYVWSGSDSAAVRRRNSTSMATAPGPSYSPPPSRLLGEGSDGGQETCQSTSPPISAERTASVSAAFLSSLSGLHIDTPLPAPGLESSSQSSFFSSSSISALETSSSSSSYVPKDHSQLQAQPPSSLAMSASPSSSATMSSSITCPSRATPQHQLGSPESVNTRANARVKARPDRTASLSTLSAASSSQQQSSSPASSAHRRLPAPSVPGGGCFALTAPLPRSSLATRSSPPRASTTLQESLIEFSLMTLDTVSSIHHRGQAPASGMEGDAAPAAVGRGSTASLSQQSFGSSPSETRSNYQQQQRQSQEVVVRPQQQPQQQIIDLTLPSSSRLVSPSPTPTPSSSSSSSQQPFSSTHPPSFLQQEHQQPQEEQSPPKALNAYFLYRTKFSAKYRPLFRFNRASGATISQALADAWKYESAEVRHEYEYMAEVERARRQPLVYGCQKRKADAMSTSSTADAGAGGKKLKVAKSKRKAAKATRAGTTTGGGSTTTGSVSGSGRAILRAALSSPSLRLGLLSLTSSTSPLSLPTSASRLGSVSEGTVSGQGRTPLVSPGTNTFINTRRATASTDAESPASAMSRSSSRSSTSSASTSLPSPSSFQMRPGGEVPPADAQAAAVLSDGGALSRTQIREGSGSQSDVTTLPRHYIHSHSRGDGESEGEGDDGVEGHDHD